MLPLTGSRNEVDLSSLAASVPNQPVIQWHAPWLADRPAVVDPAAIAQATGATRVVTALVAVALFGHWRQHVQLRWHGSPARWLAQGTDHRFVDRPGRNVLSVLPALGLVPAVDLAVAVWLTHVGAQTTCRWPALPRLLQTKPSSSHRLCDCWSVYPLAHDPLFHKVGSLAHCDCCPVDGVGVISRRATTAESLK